ncbi:MAG: GNAT family N-acetyltransferase [Pyrinomonadaceae bacterium]|nr:GNAT family N-acetyltransferase [Pyrinomonadaceae bacterium]
MKSLKVQNQMSQNEIVAGFTAFAANNAKLNNVVLLTEADRAEVVTFLSERPVHTVVMSSFIKDNGLVSADNRGKFFGYRNDSGALEGVALIGHTTLLEAKSDNALRAFAAAAKKSETPIHLLMSDGKSTESFWRYYAGPAQEPRLVCTELLFEVSFPFQVQKCAWDVRLANESELEQIAEAHAEVAFIESGVDPMLKDREGFLKRCLKRIELGRTFVVFEDGKLVFKADIVAETDSVVYLEGVYVSPEYRGRNVGSECLSALSLELLDRVEHICLLSNVDFTNAHACFAKAGFRNTDQCQTIFV